MLDSLTKRIGFRSVQLIQEPLEEPDQYGKGTTFLFEVNGVRIFMGGMSVTLSGVCFLIRIVRSAGRLQLDPRPQLPHAIDCGRLSRMAYSPS